MHRTLSYVTHRTSMPGKKQRSVYRRKRKHGFYGVQKQFLKVDSSRSTSSDSGNDVEEVLQSSQQPGPSTSSTSPQYSKNTFGNLINRSLEKLTRNCPILAEEQIDDTVNIRKRKLDLYNKNTVGLVRL